MKKIASVGVKHITCSTLKVKHDSWRKLSEVFPDVAHKLKPLYHEVGENKSGNRYLPETLRFELLKNIADLAGNAGLKFGTCREGLNRLNTGVCDGSWLINQANSLHPESGS
jgi:DNA repair photolyase